MEQKPQENKQEREVQGGVVFAKPRAKAPAPASNPMQALFGNKQLVMTIAGFLIGAVVIFVAVKIIGSVSKNQKKQKDAAATVAQQETKQAQPADKSTKPGKPKEALERGTQATNEVAESTDVRLSQIGTGGEVASETGESVVYKPPPKKPQPKKIKDTPGLMKMLDEALLKGNESALSYAVMGIEKNGDDVVDYLKEKIITNFDKPAVRINAILALFYSSKGDAVAVVKTALKVDPDEEVRLTALSVLDSLCGQEEIGFIQDIAKQDASERVRKKALEYYEIRSISQ